MKRDAEVNKVAKIEHVELGLDGRVLEVSEDEEDGHEAVVEEGEKIGVSKHKPLREANDNDPEGE